MRILDQRDRRGSGRAGTIDECDGYAVAWLVAQQRGGQVALRSDLPPINRLQFVVLLNAGASLFIAGKVTSVREGIERAAQAIDSGAARAKLDAMITASKAEAA